MQKNKNEFLFLGLPNAGKTVYFSIVFHKLQRFANDTKNFTLRFVNNETEDMIDNAINKLIKDKDEPEWPDKTQKDFDYEFKFIIPRSFWFNKDYNLTYHDYPGEVFTTAFYKSEDNAEENSPYQEEANELIERIKTAKGIFFIVDAEAMYNKKDKKEFKQSLTKLLKLFENEMNKKAKLAIIFSKAELLEMHEEFKFIEEFKNEYQNAYAHLPKPDKYKFFTVYPLGTVDINDKGDSIPPKNLEPKNIFEPFEWMVNININNNGSNEKNETFNFLNNKQIKKGLENIKKTKAKIKAKIKKS